MSTMRKQGSPGTCHLRARFQRWGLAPYALARAVMGSLALFACLISAALPALARPLDDVMQSKVLRVIVYDDFAPFSWTEESGTVKGIDADIGRAVAKELGVEANIIARIAGEEVDDDLRSNIWQGPRTGGPVGDVMLHVPMEREFIARNNLVGISNSYHYEKVVVAVHREMVDPALALKAFAKAKIAVQFSTAAHYYIMFADDEAYKNQVQPYRTMQSAVESFMSREAAGIIGPRSELEYLLGSKVGDVEILEPEYDTDIRMSWTIGTAVKQDSRDTGYAIGRALRTLENSGKLDEIFKSYGVTRVPPPTP